MSPTLIALAAATAAAVSLYLDRSSVASTGDNVERPTSLRNPGGAGTLEVSVLGPVEVRRDGSKIHLPPKALELAVYLACHPEGRSESQVMAALWPDERPTRASVRNVISRTRTALGEIDGEPAMPSAVVERCYRFHRAVRCDLEVLTAPDRAAALAAVRGVPFTADHEYLWAEQEALPSWAAAQVARIAHDLATERIAAGDPSSARDAAERGLRAAPGDDLLYRDRMLAYAAEDNRSGVERVMDELCAYFEVDDPAEVAHPATLDVYRRYAR